MEDFKNPTGWTKKIWAANGGYETTPVTMADTSTCGSPSLKMLGGHCKFVNTEVVKTFELPPHKHVKVLANMHFIDAWYGQGVYSKLDEVVTYAETSNICVAFGGGDKAMGAMVCNGKGVNICGGDAIDRVGVVSESYYQDHNTGMANDNYEIRVRFGDTGFPLDADPCEASWGLSYVMVYTR